jgi:hypothetical protein
MGRVIVFVVLLAAAPISATAQPTRAAAECTHTLQAQVDAAPSGIALVPAPCVYREKVFIDKPLVLDGQNKAEIRGSDVWTNWTQLGSIWVSQESVPSFRPDSSVAVYTDHFVAQQMEQVVMDGVALKHVVAAPDRCSPR